MLCKVPLLGFVCRDHHSARRHHFHDGSQCGVSRSIVYTVSAGGTCDIRYAQAIELFCFAAQLRLFASSFSYILSRLCWYVDVGLESTQPGAILNCISAEEGRLLYMISEWEHTTTVSIVVDNQIGGEDQ